MSAPRARSRSELRNRQRRRSHSCWDHLIVAALWPLHGANLGTLLRTCDAAGACLAVPRRPWVPEALARGSTLRRRTCVHWVGRDELAWLDAQHERGSEIIGVELTDESIRLAVEIPMLGTGTSLNVAVAGSLVLYKIAGLV